MHSLMHQSAGHPQKESWGNEGPAQATLSWTMMKMFHRAQRGKARRDESTTAAPLQLRKWRIEMRNLTSRRSRTRNMRVSVRAREMMRYKLAQ
ncbi:hypothetical protein SCLCIDRAFT_774843 [Scleroderma citrinum Foug A]|uniref:Uncharacterized protein n=1 Tax=Scleroderma citrinum Foug A TaxID=1036808 RepID=A0A0C3E3L4_9AGAM|nr:hypothetical protein SCLCIDRAFT_774843 [Scleroderma citrinum Foug A]